MKAKEISVKNHLPDMDRTFQLSVLGMFIISSRGHIIRSNKAVEEMFGEDIHLKGKMLQDLFFGEPPFELEEFLPGITEEESITDEQMIMLGTNKENAFWALIYFSAFNDPDTAEELFLVQVQNISDLKKARDEVYYHNNLVNDLINSIPDNVFIKDKDSKFLLANRSVALLMGAESGRELIGKTDFDFYPKKMARKFRNDEIQILETGEAKINIVEQVIDRKHDRHWYSTSKLPLRNSNGEIVGIMGIGREITNLVKEKKALRKAKLAAEKADQLKTAFLVNLSHEVRTPLNGILGFSQFLKKSFVDDPKTNKYIEYIIRNGKRLLYLISDMVDLSKIECNQLVLKPKKFNVSELMHKLERTLHLMLEEAEKQEIEGIMDLDPVDEDIYITQDDQRIEQIMYNLLSNAVKFTDKGSIHFGYTKQGHQLRFFVRDTGIGIGDKEIPYIFERFTQVDNSLARQYEGAGLGLALVKSLLGLFKSKIELTTEPGKGSEFAFTLKV